MFVIIPSPSPSREREGNNFGLAATPQRIPPVNPFPVIPANAGTHGCGLGRGCALSWVHRVHGSRRSPG